MERSRPLTLRATAAFWAPLAATWLMMSVEGPFVAAIIARLADPTLNLAAYGVAFTFAWIFEAPIIMMMSAATALTRDRQAFLKLRRFTFALNGLVTVVMLIGLLPPVFRFFAERMIGLPDEVAGLTHSATLLLLPWPAAIGYRRFYQGVMIRHGFPRGVAYGTVLRVSVMGCAALAARLMPGLPGACAGAIALVAGVVAEAAASRAMAAGVVRRLLREPPDVSHEPLTYRAILRFYAPLALTSIIALAVNPMVTFFLGRSRLAIESLAVFPVVMSLTFVFRGGGIALQETSIALMGERQEHLPTLRRFAAIVAGTLGGALVIVAFSPLGRLWFRDVAGLAPLLASISMPPLRLMCLMPAFEVLMSLERSLLVHQRRTGHVTLATAVEVTGIVTGLIAGIRWLDLVGATAAAAAIQLGRAAAACYLFPLTLGRRTPTRG